MQSSGSGGTIRTSENNNNVKQQLPASGGASASTSSHAATPMANGANGRLASQPSVQSLEEYDRPPGKEKNSLVRVEDLERYMASMSESEAFKQQFNMLKTGQQAAWTAAVLPENKSKNRYMDLLPYDETRVVLQPLKDDPSSDFINANYIHGYNRQRAYIGTQGPLERTVVDFWRMVWQEHVCKIVMTANIIESGKKKCEKYWPDATTKYGDLMVTLQSEAVFLDYTVRTFKVQKAGKSCRRLVRQYQFTDWPDHGIPQYSLSVVYMLRSIKNFQPTNKSPVVMHCSAGVGRSGTLMLLDACLDMARAEGKVDVLGILYKMRQQRVNMVETLEQYMFVHQVLVDVSCGDDPCIPATHIVMYYNRLRLTETDGAKTKIQLQYERLEKLTPPIPDDRFIAARAPDYKSKNRFENILAPECGRPVLRGGSAQNYVNAVYVHGYGVENAFVATQFPLPETVKDFWQLVYETGSRTIVTLNELLKNDESCPVFWPESGSAYHGSLRLDHTASDEAQGFKCRQFKLRNVDESKRSRVVKQFHLSNWGRDDVAPPSVEAVLRLLAKVDKWQHKSGDNTVLVTCYNGVKASGFFCAASYLSEQMLREKELDVFTALRTVRIHRPQFVAREQYRWLYELACALSTNLNRR